MPNNRVKDSVDLYRFKVTDTVDQNQPHYGYEQIEPNVWQKVEFIGFYANKYKYEPWIPNRGTLKIEHQKLQVVGYLGELGWTTIETKTYKDGERDD